MLQNPQRIMMGSKLLHIETITHDQGMYTILCKGTHMQPHLLQKLYKDLVRHEGKELQAYKDSLGYVTVGIGHLVKISDGIKEGDCISEEQCQQLFEQDVDSAISACVQMFPNFYELCDDAQCILANMMFNLGATRLGYFVNLRQAIAQKHYIRAAFEMSQSKWFEQVKGRGKELVDRMMSCVGEV